MPLNEIDGGVERLPRGDLADFAPDALPESLPIALERVVRCATGEPP